MKRILTAALVLGTVSPGILGCADKTKSKQETQVTTPGGTTTVTTEKEIKKTGENPPPAKP